MMQILHFKFCVLAALLAWGVGFAVAAELGLPPLPHPAHNLPTPGSIALGKKLFHDKRLSADGSVSCATCHIPEKAFADGLTVAKGLGGQTGTRNTPTLLNVAFEKNFFWDGRRATLEEQAQDPFINPREHGFKEHTQLIATIRNNQAYRLAFKKAFSVQPEAITMEHVTRAIASFERTLIAADTFFDRYYYGGDQTAMSEAAIRGLALFKGNARCASCHIIGETSTTFTDNQFHSLGIGYRKIEQRLAKITTHFAKQRGKPIDHSILSDADVSELGRFTVTLNPMDIAKFRTPSLRNVALTAPYMHDGSVSTLAEVVELEVYYRSLESGQPLILTPQEQSDLLAFLRALTSGKAAKQATGIKQVTNE
ncbi:MAG: cytochrome c peroxidase [Gallionellaceae bacterium]|nr:cytochrome c peroxidase [Gallionellaceae bacterium]